MGKILEFTENKEPLKICIMNYEEFDIDVIHVSKEYFTKHWKIFKRKKDRNVIEKKEFHERLYAFLWTPKISELLITLYLEDLKGNHPIIYKLNRLLKRTSNQCPSTSKAIKKLKSLDIVYTEPILNAKKGEKKVYINKNIVKIYGDDEFKQMMLDEWDMGDKEYVIKRLNKLKQQKEEFKKRIELINKGKREKK